MNAFDVAEIVIKEKTKFGVFKRRELIEAILGELKAAGLLAEDIYAVSVTSARVPVESVQAYGLDISLDANGNAVTVGSPYGFEIQEED